MKKNFFKITQSLFFLSFCILTQQIIAQVEDLSSNLNNMKDIVKRYKMVVYFVDNKPWNDKNTLAKIFEEASNHKMYKHPLTKVVFAYCDTSLFTPEQRNHFKIPDDKPVILFFNNHGKAQYPVAFKMDPLWIEGADPLWKRGTLPPDQKNKKIAQMIRQSIDYFYFSKFWGQAGSPKPIALVELSNLSQPIFSMQSSYQQHHQQQQGHNIRHHLPQMSQEHNVKQFNHIDDLQFNRIDDLQLYRYSNDRVVFCIVGAQPGENAPKYKAKFEQFAAEYSEKHPSKKIHYVFFKIHSADQEKQVFAVFENRLKNNDIPILFTFFNVRSEYRNFISYLKNNDIPGLITAVDSVFGFKSTAGQQMTINVGAARKKRYGHGHVSTGKRGKAPVHRKASTTTTRKHQTSQKQVATQPKTQVNKAKPQTRRTNRAPQKRSDQGNKTVKQQPKRQPSQTPTQNKQTTKSTGRSTQRKQNQRGRGRRQPNQRRQGPRTTQQPKNAKYTTCRNGVCKRRQRV